MTATGWDKFNRIANLLIDPVGRAFEYMNPTMRTVDGGAETLMGDTKLFRKIVQPGEAVAEYGEEASGDWARVIRHPDGREEYVVQTTGLPQGWDRVKADFNAPAGERSLFDWNSRSIATVPMSAALYYGGYSMLTPDERRQYPQQEY